MRTPDLPQNLEDAAAIAIGRTVLVFSNIEFNLGLWLRNAVSSADAEAANPLVDRLPFKAKLDALQDVARHKHAHHPEALTELAAWVREMDRFRVIRNAFMHGRWGVLHASGQVVNVATGLPGHDPQRETRYSISELEDAHVQARSLSESFCSWIKRWPV